MRCLVVLLSLHLLKANECFEDETSLLQLRPALNGVSANIALTDATAEDAEDIRAEETNLANTTVQDCEDDYDVSQENEWLALVNAKRAAHGACPVTWDDKLAKYIGKWVGCLFTMDHSVKGQDRGEIISDGNPGGRATTAGPPYNSPEKAVGGWYSEVNHCSKFPGCEDTFPVTGHFTSMVWQASTTMGCAIRKSDGRFAGCQFGGFPKGKKKKGKWVEHPQTPNIRGQYTGNVQALGTQMSGCR